MSLLRIDATDTDIDALLDVMALGIAEAIADNLLDRQERVSLMAACRAMRLLDHMQHEVSAGRKDTCTEEVG